MNKKAFLLLSLIAGLLLGCSQQSSEKQSASSSKKQSSVVLNIGDQKGNMRAQLEASGALDQVDYKINWYEFPAAAPVAEALKVNAIDIGYLGDAPFLFANSNGGTAKAIAVYVSDAYPTAILVPANSPIQSAKDLKGKSLAFNKGSISHLLTLKVLEREGIKPEEVSFKFLPPADGKLAVSSGAVDAWVVWDPYTAYAELKDGFRIIANGRGLYSGYTFLAGTQKALQDQSKRVAIQDFIYRLKRAQLWSDQHPDEFGKLYAKIVGLPEDVGELAFKRRAAKWQPIDDQTIQVSQATADFYRKYGLIQKDFDVSQSFDRTFQVEKK